MCIVRGSPVTKSQLDAITTTINNNDDNPLRFESEIMGDDPFSFILTFFFCSLLYEVGFTPNLQT